MDEKYPLYFNSLRRAATYIQDECCGTVTSQKKKFNEMVIFVV